MSLTAEAAIPQLLDAHGGRIYALGLKMCGNPDDAADVVQDTFFQAFRKWGQFEARSSPATWLYSIASRACMRRNRRRSGEPEEMVPLSEHLSPPHGSAPDPLDEQVRREAHEALERAITTLPERFRLPLLLKEIADFSVSEVAEVLSLEPGTVRTRVHRARLMLREALKIPESEAEYSTAEHRRRVCLDLLAAKQEALDRGVAFPLPSDELCRRCMSTFAALDLGTDVCAQLGATELPLRVHSRILERLGNRDGP